MKDCCVALVAFVLCAATVTNAGVERVPVLATTAKSALVHGTAIGKYQVLTLVPEEPRAELEALMFFTGVDLDDQWGIWEPAQSGLAVKWDPQHRWRAMPAQIVCKPSECSLSYDDTHVLSVVPGDIVFLNVSGMPGQQFAYMEAELPLKNQTSGRAETLPIPQSRVVGVFASVHATGVGSCVNTMPRHDTWMQQVSYTAAMNREKELPLNWNITKPGSCGERFTHYATQLNIRWWDGKKH